MTHIILQKFRVAKPKSGYEGSKLWAKHHAARLQHLVGALEDGRRITRILAKPYGHSLRKWGIAKFWAYDGKPNLGEHGGGYLWLPYD